jgi:rod shape-determining protein MreC
MTMVVGFLIVSLALIVMDRQSLLDPVRDGLSEVVSPVQSGIGRLLDNSRSESELEQELTNVTGERDALLAENANLKAQQQELEALRELQQVQEANPGFTYIPARVIGRDPTGLQYWVTIDKGTEDGLALGMAVVNPNVYVGQITAIEANEAVVTFIIDTSMRVGAKAVDTRGDGVVYGQWNVGGRLVLRNVDRQFPPNDGEMIVTADASNVQTRQVPPGIPIGFVSGTAQPNDQTDELEVEVVPYISNFKDLQILYVVTDDAQS